MWSVLYVMLTGWTIGIPAVMNSFQHVLAVVMKPDSLTVNPRFHAKESGLWAFVCPNKSLIPSSNQNISGKSTSYSSMIFTPLHNSKSSGVSELAMCNMTPEGTRLRSPTWRARSGVSTRQTIVTLHALIRTNAVPLCVIKSLLLVMNIPALIW